MAFHHLIPLHTFYFSARVLAEIDLCGFPPPSSHSYQDDGPDLSYTATTFVGVLGTSRHRQRYLFGHLSILWNCSVSFCGCSSSGTFSIWRRTFSVDTATGVFLRGCGFLFGIFSYPLFLRAHLASQHSRIALGCPYSHYSFRLDWGAFAGLSKRPVSYVRLAIGFSLIRGFICALMGFMNGIDGMRFTLGGWLALPLLSARVAFVLCFLLFWGSVVERYSQWSGYFLLAWYCSVIRLINLFTLYSIAIEPFSMWRNTGPKSYHGSSGSFLDLLLTFLDWSSLFGFAHVASSCISFCRPHSKATPSRPP